MKDDKQRPERANRLRLKMPAGPWRALVVGLLAARALSPHGVSADSGVTVTVTSYRICILHGCSRTEVGRLAPGQDQTTALGTDR
ncbi:MAG TPA: hypothetical protein VHR65_08945 [Solirubrobacterales bacterium]|jgi:hypothetical protein|nr:hypothetical protein [Solirubrobacterales bacterium]